MLLPLWIGVGTLAALASTSSSSTQEPSPHRAPLRSTTSPEEDTHTGEDQEPTPQASSSREVMDAFIDELASQSQSNMAHVMASVARRTLTHHQGTWSSIVIPCDQRLHKALPEASLLERIAETLGKAYEVGVEEFPARWTHPDLGSVAVCAIVFYDANTPPPTAQEALQPMEDALRRMVSRGEFIEYDAEEQFGGILDMVLNTIIASSVGTVTSMGTQSLVRSAGGEPRLARLMRRYKRARARGDTSNARRIQNKITRTASRLKGRKVNWNEVEQIIGES